MLNEEVQGFKGSLLRPPGYAGQAGFRGLKVLGSASLLAAEADSLIEKATSASGVSFKEKKRILRRRTSIE
jgi:hypothetical protein